MMDGSGMDPDGQAMQSDLSAEDTAGLSSFEGAGAESVLAPSAAAAPAAGGTPVADAGTREL